MISVKANSLWKGRVGIREKYVSEAIDKNQDLLLIHLNEQMLILSTDIPFEIVGRSKETFPDQFSEERHHLVYFRWKPTQTQRSLI